MRKVRGSRPAGLQEKKNEKYTLRGWVIWSRKREKNRAKGRRESGKRQRTLKSCFIHTISSIFIHTVVFIIVYIHTLGKVHLI